MEVRNTRNTDYKNSEYQKSQHCKYGEMETWCISVGSVLEKSFPPTRTCTQVKIYKVLVSPPQ